MMMILTIITMTEVIMIRVITFITVIMIMAAAAATTIIILIITSIKIIITVLTRSSQRAQTFDRREHLESANLCQGHRSLPKFNGLLLVSSSIFPESFIEIHS